MSVTTPLELWNGAVHSYDSIPDDPHSYNPQQHAPHHHGHCSWDRCGRLLIVPMTAVGLLCMGGFAILGSYMTPGKAHQETVVPTLLSIMDPHTHTHLYALRNPLYDRLQQAKLLDFSNSPWAAKGIEIPKLWLDKTQILPGESLTVFWTLGRTSDTGNTFLQEDLDVIALYCDESDSFLEAATISQIRATSEFNGASRDLWFIPSFPNLRQDHCHFRLYVSLPTTNSAKSGEARGTSNDDDNTLTNPEQYVHIASSEKLTITDAKEMPLAIHIALTNEASRMIVQFTTGDVPDAVPVARISAAKDDTTTSMLLVEGSTDTYSSADLCQSPGNLTQAGMFYPPGMLHTIEFNNLKPNTEYKYQVGLRQTDAVLIWSDEYIFRTALAEGDEEPFSYIVYGDQGCPYMGWQGGQDWLVAMIARENATSIHHFGDISYARGAAHIWDNWFQMVQPVAARVPLLVAVGNHEYDHTDGGGLGKDPSGVVTAHGFMPSWGNFGDDSGGECGVPMAKRFQMPTTAHSNGVFWYSFNYGLLHTIVISSEHDLSPGSPQYIFLEHDLATVDRTKTPWVVLESHRPLYEGEGSGVWWPQNLVGEAMRDEFEDLLVAHHVDIVLGGHYHEYQRTCDGLYKGQCGKEGPIHITIGSAGAKLDAGFDLVNVWTANFIKGEYGYGRITVSNRTELHFEFVLHGSAQDDRGGKVLDDIWIHRTR